MAAMCEKECPDGSLPPLTGPPALLACRVSTARLVLRCIPAPTSFAQPEAPCTPTLFASRRSTFFFGCTRLSITDDTHPSDKLKPSSSKPHPDTSHPPSDPARRSAGLGRLQRPLGRPGRARRSGRGWSCGPGWFFRRGRRSGCAGRQLVSCCNSPHRCVGDVIADGGGGLGSLGGCCAWELSLREGQVRGRGALWRAHVGHLSNVRGLGCKVCCSKCGAVA